MIDCPKCHFRQPKDQYCASCGINMVTFKPLQVSKTKTFFESGIFQIFLLLLIAVGIAYFITQTERPQNWVKKFSYYKRTTDSIKSSTTKSFATQIASDPQTQEKIEVTASATANTNDLAIEPKTTNEQPSFTEIKISYIEISNEDLTNLIGESQRQDLYQSSPDLSAGIVPNYKSKTQFKVLKSELKKLNAEPVAFTTINMQ